MRKIVAFIFIILEQREKSDYDGNITIEENVPIEKHFDFRLNGSVDGVDRQDDIDGYQPESSDFAYAYFRDELKAKERVAIQILILK